MNLRHLLSLAVAASAFSLAAPSFAAPKPRIALRLAYDKADTSAAECPDAEQLGLMISAEFGYVVMRPDASALLTVNVRRSPKGFQADLSAPSPTEEGALWERTTREQGTCQELAYDVAALVKLGLGPLGWPDGEPPVSLAAPPEYEVGEVEIRPARPRLPVSLAALTPAATPETKPMGPPTIGGIPLQAEISLSANVMPYGLPGFAVGGGGMIQLRLSIVGLGMEIRGATMVSRGFGTPVLDARASVTSLSFPLCVLSRYLDVCGTVGPSVLSLDAPPPLEIKFADGLSWSVGARLAGRYPISKQFTFFAFGDGSFQLWPIIIRGISPDDSTVVVNYWQSPTFRVIFGAGVAFAMFE